MSIVLITGTSTGIGLATTVHFARAGHAVYAGVRNLATATALTEAMEKEMLGVTPVVIDVDDVASVQHGVGEVLAKAGQVDVLVNNAGIGGGGPLEDVPVDWAKGLFETNYFGVIRMIQAVLPGMRERRSGTIVNVSSIAGRVAIAGHGHYSAVKHALEAASEALAQELLAFGIRVAIVEPGVVITPIFSKARRFADPASPYAEHVRRLLGFYQKQLPWAAQPADVAAVIHEAVTTSAPRLRWLVGEDAKRLAEGRRRLSDGVRRGGRTGLHRRVPRDHAQALRFRLALRSGGTVMKRRRRAGRNSLIVVVFDHRLTRPARAIQQGQPPRQTHRPPSGYSAPSRSSADRGP